MKTFVGTLKELKRIHDKEQPDKGFTVCLSNARVHFEMFPFDLRFKSLMHNLIPQDEIVLYCIDPLDNNKTHFVICPNLDYFIERVIFFLTTDDI